MMWFRGNFARHSRKRGFTLIELIIVIAILTILAAILIPCMLGFIEQVNNTAEVSNAKTCARLINNYFTLHDDKMQELIDFCAVPKSNHCIRIPVGNQVAVMDPLLA